MNTTLIVAVIALTGTIFGALFTYFGVARRLSGKIATSEATDLWAEAGKIRADFMADNERLRTRIGTLEEKINTLTIDNLKCRDRIKELEVKLIKAGKMINGDSDAV